MLGIRWMPQESYVCPRRRRESPNPVRHSFDTNSTQNRHSFDTFVGVDTKSTQFRHKGRSVRRVEGLVEHKAFDALASILPLKPLFFNNLERVNFCAS